MDVKTQFVRNGDVHIAYQVIGDGPIDLVISPGFISHVDMMWAAPASRAWLERLATFARIIHYDKPGTGASDPLDAPVTIEDRHSDLEAVLDAAGADRVSLLGVSEGGPTSILYSARNPERVDALVLHGTYAAGPGPRSGVTFDDVVAGRANLGGDNIWPAHTVTSLTGWLNDWGSGESLRLMAPSRVEPATLSQWGQLERMAASPRMARLLVHGVWDLDVRPLLATIDVPTLVVAREGDLVSPLAMAKELAAGIPGARLAIFPGPDHLPWLDSDDMVDEIEEFLTGARAPRQVTRALSTVLFTDVVDSTRTASEMGDGPWRQTLEAHDRVVSASVQANNGRIIKSLGDGHLAEFPGPASAVRAAQRAQSRVRQLGLELRAGVHTGEVERMGDDLGGIAVHIGARVSSKAGPGEVWVSSTVPGLVFGSGLTFESRGTHELKGVPGAWELFAVTG